jgi:hypothetical protein
MMATIVQTTARVGVGFVPYVGPMLDFCEAVTGKAWCLPDGEELSDEQRIFAGAGVAVGQLGKFWGGVKGAGVGAKSAAVAGVIAQVPEEIAAGVRASPGKLYKTLRGAMATKLVNDAEKKVAQVLADEGQWFLGIGDDGVRKVLGIPAESPPGTILGKAPDFLSVTKSGGLCLTEVKGSLSNTDAVRDAVNQLTNAATKVQEQGLLGELEKVQLAIPKGTNCRVAMGLRTVT